MSITPENTYQMYDLEELLDSYRQEIAYLRDVVVSDSYTDEQRETEIPRLKRRIHGMSQVVRSEIDKLKEILINH